MARARKTWQEKLADSKGLPRVGEITDNMSKRWGTGTFIIPAPIEVDEVMRKVWLSCEEPVFSACKPSGIPEHEV